MIRKKIKTAKKPLKSPRENITYKPPENKKLVKRKSNSWGYKGFI